MHTHTHTNTMKLFFVMVVFLWFPEATRMGATSQSFVVLNEVVTNGRDIPSPPPPISNRSKYQFGMIVPPTPDLS